MSVPYIGVMANTSCRIKTLWAKFAEIAGAFREGRYRYTRSFALAVAEALVVAEEESFVTLDGATESAAELIALERFDALREKTFCVEGVVADKFPENAMKRICAGACDNIGRGAGTVTEFGIRSVGKNSELSDRVDRRFQDEATIDAVEIVGAIDQKIIRFGALAVDGISLTFTQGTAGGGKSGCDGHNAGLKNAELSEVAAIERQVKNFAFLHGFAETGGGALNQRRVGIYFDFVGLAADHEAEGDVGVLIDVERDAVTAELLKTSGSGFDAIVANGEGKNYVCSVRIGCRLALQSGFDLGGGDGGAGDRGAAGIEDCATNASRNLLRARRKDRRK